MGKKEGGRWIRRDAAVPFLLSRRKSKMHLPEKFLDRMRDLLEEDFPAFWKVTVSPGSMA